MDEACITEGGVPLIPDDRIFEAVNILLSYQNSDGGWATYENNRGYGWYEALNPSEVRRRKRWCGDVWAAELAPTASMGWSPSGGAAFLVGRQVSLVSQSDPHQSDVQPG